MARIIPETMRPIILKKLLAINKIKHVEFAELFSKETGINLSQTSCRFMLNYGHDLKRVPEFKKTIAEFVAKHYSQTLEKLEIKSENLWDTWEAVGKEINPTTENTEFLMKLKMFTEATMLSKDTMNHFGLKSSPFTPQIRQESEIYLSASHVYALEVMREAAEYGGFAVVTGQVGSGKTTVLSKFLEENRINQKYQIIFPEAIDKTRLNANQILQACVFDLTESHAKGGMEALSRQVKNLLIKRSDNRERTVIIIEEAHDLSEDTLKNLKRMWEMRSGLARLLGIILIGQNELEYRLYGKANTNLREVSARATHARVEPIQDELGEYIAHRVRAIKGDINKIITPEAVAELSKRMTIVDRNGKQQSVAYPLMINNIMNRLMNMAADSGEEIITPDVIKSAGI